MVTRKELAQRANVAESTVTRVLNGGYASEATRRKVMALAKELNYTPNALAQGLRTRRTKQIACVVLSIDSPFYGPTLLGVEEVANARGYVLAVYSANVVEQSLSRSFFAGRHDGIILLSINHDRLLGKLHGVRTPIVSYSDTGHPMMRQNRPLPTVAINLYDSMRDIVQHLVRLGHREIGYIGSLDADKRDNPRLNGFMAGRKLSGLPVSENDVQYIPGLGSMESGYTGMSELRRKLPNITAVVTMNDLVGLGAIRWMQEQGIRIPEDVSIIGCDDIAYSSMCYPPLTTVQIPKREIGHHLMQMALQTIEQGPHMNDPPFTLLPTRLIVRASATNVRR